MVKKVFIVDDDDVLSMALEDYLARKTLHEVHIYKTGEECLKNLREQPDVVILDFHLDSDLAGAANGIEVLESIKKINKYIHVIMLSSQEAYGTALQTLRKGAEEYVIKGEDAFEKIVSLIDGLKN
jgi:two-component system OmpR family response regulator